MLVFCRSDATETILHKAERKAAKVGETGRNVIHSSTMISVAWQAFKSYLAVFPKITATE